MRQIYLFFIALGLISFAACNLEKEIELELPTSESVVVVECYLEPGQPYTLLLSRTAGYFEPFPTSDVEFVANLLEDGASVRITYQGEVIDLEEGFFFNPASGKFFNYGTDKIVPEDFTNDFALEIITADGETITSTTRILQPVPIDSVVIKFNGIDTLAQALMYFTDDTTQPNFYRALLHQNSLDSIPDLNFPVNDELVDNATVVFGTAYSYAKGDTLYHTLFHIDEAYYKFLLSFQNAIGSNGNPFAQPGGIVSNVSGGGAIGIFTGLSYVRTETYVPK
ncbi:MAG: DUF4249 domain-containing protein [Saprospiraceae bacterium]|nr:DUF4249 domain-containing protein [Saprospiraceae bacterium]